MFFQKNILEIASDNKKNPFSQKEMFYFSYYPTELGKWVVVTDVEERIWKISYLRSRSLEEVAIGIKKELQLSQLEWREPREKDVFQTLWKNWCEAKPWSSRIQIGLYGTQFERTVWRALIQVPYGDTVSYGQLGRLAKVGSNKGRAIGGAMGRNRLMLIVPCHRVISANGKLGGFQWGPGLKTQLLRHENALPVLSLHKD